MCPSLPGRVHVTVIAAVACAVLIFCTGQEEIATAVHALRELASDLRETNPETASLDVLPLHASLPSDEQVWPPAIRQLLCQLITLQTRAFRLVRAGARVHFTAA